MLYAIINIVIFFAIIIHVANNLNIFNGYADKNATILIVLYYAGNSK